MDAIYSSEETILTYSPTVLQNAMSHVTVQTFTTKKTYSESSIRNIKSIVMSALFMYDVCYLGTAHISSVLYNWTRAGCREDRRSGNENRALWVITQRIVATSYRRFSSFPSFMSRSLWILFILRERANNRVKTQRPFFSCCFAEFSLQNHLYNGTWGS